MKQRKNKTFFAVAAIVAVGLGSYKAYESYTAANMSDEDLFLAENIEAMSNGESQGYTAEFCYQSSSTGLGGQKTVCASGTGTISSMNGYEPNGTMYPCTGSMINGSLTSSLGYCLKSAN